MFSWGLRYHFPCCHHELKPTSTYPGDPPMPLASSLYLLLALWVQLKLSFLSSTDALARPFHFWEHSLSIHIFQT